jgi:hypothetical protein
MSAAKKNEKSSDLRLQEAEAIISKIKLKEGYVIHEEMKKHNNFSQPYKNLVDFFILQLSPYSLIDFTNNKMPFTETNMVWTTGDVNCPVDFYYTSLHLPVSFVVGKLPSVEDFEKSEFDVNDLPPDNWYRKLSAFQTFLGNLYAAKGLYIVYEPKNLSNPFDVKDGNLHFHIIESFAESICLGQEDLFEFFARLRGM